MEELIKLFIYNLIFYNFLTLPFIPLYRQGVFEYYIMKNSKTLEDKVSLAIKHRIPAVRTIGWSLILTYKITPRDFYIEQVQTPCTFAECLSFIILSNFFLLAALGILVKKVLETLESGSPAQIIIASLWLLFGIWRYGKIISFLPILWLEDKKSETHSK